MQNLAAHERSPPRTARMLMELEKHGQTTNRFQLQPNLYNSALMCQLGVPGLDDKPSIANALGRHSVLPLMLLVTFIQLTMAWSVYLHVQNSMIFKNTRPLLTAYEMFIGSNVTIPLHTVEALCGEWEDHEMKDFAKGPLSYTKTSDGSIFAPDDTYSLFYNVKQPDRTWNYAYLGTKRSVLDDALFVISEGLTLNPFTPNSYSLLFILTVCLMYVSLLIEIRQVARFAMMLIHLCGKGGPTFKQSEDGAWSLANVPPGGQVVGWIAVVCRLTVAVVLMMLGSLFLVYTTLKIDLILNGLALAFLMELNVMFYFASTPSSRQQWLKDLEPVEYTSDGYFARFFREIQILPVVMLLASFLLTCLMRSFQLQIFRRIFRLTSAICLFAGPTVPFARHDIVHPAAGFCDSLLGVKCAPHVKPLSTLKEHGHCLVTDKTVTSNPTFTFYLDDPTLIADRYNESGAMKSWVEWGDSNPRLFQSGLWFDGPYQDILRKNCLQMYQKTVKPDDVLVDDDAGETMDGAPFQCPRDAIFNAVFGKVFDSLDKMPIHEMIDQVADLTDPAVVHAIDNCKSYKEPTTQLDKEVSFVELSERSTKRGADPPPVPFSQVASRPGLSLPAVSGMRVQATRGKAGQQTHLRHDGVIRPTEPDTLYVKQRIWFGSVLGLDRNQRWYTDWKLWCGLVMYCSVWSKWLLFGYDRKFYLKALHALGLDLVILHMIQLYEENGLVLMTLVIIIQSVLSAKIFYRPKDLLKEGIYYSNTIYSSLSSSFTQTCFIFIGQLLFTGFYFYALHTGLQEKRGKFHYLFWLTGFVAAQMSMYFNKGKHSQLGEVMDVSGTFFIWSHINQLQFTYIMFNGNRSAPFSVSKAKWTARCIMNFIINLLVRDLIAFSVPVLIMTFNDPLNCVVYSMGVNFIATMDDFEQITYSLVVSHSNDSNDEEP